MVTTGLIAIDATILATAVPTITRDLGCFSSFPWLFSIYLLAQAVAVPIYSKLADVLGRKPIILIGIGLTWCSRDRRSPSSSMGVFGIGAPSTIASRVLTPGTGSRRLRAPLSATPRRRSR